MLNGHSYTAPPGCRGFDCNTALTRVTAAAMATKYRFGGRYVRRELHHDFDLTLLEAEIMLEAKLGILPIQHVQAADPDTWYPTGLKGTQDGIVAAAEMRAIGFPPGVMGACDWEGVDKSTAVQDAIDYLVNWHRAVAGNGGYVPALYIGFGYRLTAQQLYDHVPFTHYIGAYNTDPGVPAVRGVQIQQHEAKAADRPAGVTFSFQTDVVRVDALGGLPTIFGSDAWYAGASLAPTVFQ